MSFMHAAPLLLGSLVGILLGLVISGFWRARGYQVSDPLMEPRDEMLLGLVVLVAFALGVFVTYILLIAGF